MILSDKSILKKLKKGEIKITPFDLEFLQPASYDLHLGPDFLRYKKPYTKIIDVKKPVTELMEKIELKDGDPIIIKPREIILGNIMEITGVDEKHVGRLEGKSSIGRLGLIIHATAGFLDAGNEVKLTLQMVNLSPLPIKLYVGMKIAQIAFEQLDETVDKPYGSNGLNSKYYMDLTVRESMFYKNFEKKD